MTQEAREAFARSLKDVETILEEIGRKTGGRRGPITDQSVEPLLKAAIIFLVAALEVYIEELFKFAVRCRFPNLDDASRDLLLQTTVDRFNIPSADETDRLFLNIGIPFVTRDISWQRMSNKSFKKRLHELIELRGQITHGKDVCPSLTQLRGFKNFVEVYADRLEKKLRTELGD